MAKEKSLKPPVEKLKGRVTIEIPQAQFPVILYANTFGLEHLDGHKLVHFGLSIPPSRVTAAWACVFEDRAIEEGKESWLKYLREIEFSTESADTSFRAPVERLTNGVPSANIVTLARTGEIGEIRFFCFSIGDLVEDRREAKSGKIKGQPLALIRLALELQRQFIAAIYQDLDL